MIAAQKTFWLEHDHDNTLGDVGPPAADISDRSDLSVGVGVTSREVCSWEHVLSSAVDLEDAHVVAPPCSGR